MRAAFSPQGASSQQRTWPPACLPACRPCGARPATWPRSCSATALRTARCQTCGRWGVCCTSAPWAGRPSSTRPSTSWCTKSSTTSRSPSPVRMSPALPTRPQNGHPVYALAHHCCGRAVRNAADVATHSPCPLRTAAPPLVVRRLAHPLPSCPPPCLPTFLPPSLPAGASPEYHDLITRLLDKNPATRLRWRVRTRTGTCTATATAQQRQRQHHQQRQHKQPGAASERRSIPQRLPNCHSSPSGRSLTYLPAHPATFLCKHAACCLPHTAPARCVHTGTPRARACA